MSLFDLGALAGLRQQVAGLGDEVRKRRAEIEKLRQQRDELLAAPAAKSDLKDAARQYLDDERHDFAVHLQRKLAPLIRNPAKLQNRELVARHFSAFGAPVPNESMPSGETMDCSLLGLFNALALDAYMSTIDGMSFETGPTLKARAAKVAALDKQIAEASAELEELVNTARSAGVALEV